MSTPTQFDDAALRDLIACPRCDLLHRSHRVADGCVGRCKRCHTPLIMPRAQAIPRIIALSLTVLILLVGALYFPFLELNAGGFSNSASLLDAATAFNHGLLIPLSGAVAAFMVLLPAVRVASLVYALVPLLFHQPPARYSAYALRLANRLRPWAMAEIFIIGVVVALVKIVDLADVTPGPAFWAFSVMVIILVLNDTYMCRWTLWNALTARR